MGPAQEAACAGLGRSRPAQSLVYTVYTPWGSSGACDAFKLS